MGFPQAQQPREIPKVHGLLCGLMLEDVTAGSGMLQSIIDALHELPLPHGDVTGGVATTCCADNEPFRVFQPRFPGKVAYIERRWVAESCSAALPRIAPFSEELAAVPGPFWMEISSLSGEGSPRAEAQGIRWKSNMRAARRGVIFVLGQVSRLGPVKLSRRMTAAIRCREAELQQKSSEQ